MRRNNFLLKLVLTLYSTACVRDVFLTCVFRFLCRSLCSRTMTNILQAGTENNACSALAFYFSCYADVWKPGHETLLEVIVLETGNAHEQLELHKHKLWVKIVVVEFWRKNPQAVQSKFTQDSNILHPFILQIYLMNINLALFFAQLSIHRYLYSNYQ